MSIYSNRLKSILLHATLFLISFESHAQCLLPAPKEPKAKLICSCQFLAKWKLVTGAVNYTLQYKKTSADSWTTISNTGNVDSYTLTALEPDTSYEMKVAAVCASGETGLYTEPIEVKTVNCTVPVDLAATGITASSATLSWSVVCSAPKFTVRYRKSGIIEWAAYKSIPETHYTFTGLEPNTKYEVKVESKCTNGDSEYSPSIFFTTTSIKTGKNVLLIIVDDARFDSYTATGGPSFFNDVNISRIANEGVNFTQSFATFSLCAPSRGTIITGVYPHLHGITDNVSSYASDTLDRITIAQILQDHGYYTGLIGKYHISYIPQEGFNYWLESHNNFYVNSKCNVNGTEKVMPAHMTDVVTDSAIAFFHKVPAGQPFFLWLGYKAPHLPPVPKPEDDGIFDSFDMPFPDNYIRYSENSPDFLYTCHYYGDTDYIKDYYRGYYELLNGVETRLGDIFNELSSMGLMDSTLIIFMSDNGYMLGEHLLLEKQLAYEESIHIPIFMRYPSLITPGTVVNDQIALNLDIAPTILDFAGIPDTFGMQGISLLKLADGRQSRKEMMYEFYNKVCVPDIRGVRSVNYKYVEYHCPTSTEEFFDLLNDPHENNNLANDTAYSALLMAHRDKLTFFRNYYEDYSWDSLYNCSLSNPQRLEQKENEPLSLLHISPNPASSGIMIHFISSEKNAGSLQIVNCFGQIIYREKLSDPHTDYFESIDLNYFPSGNYFVIIQHGSHAFKESFVKQ